MSNSILASPQKIPEATIVPLRDNVDLALLLSSLNMGLEEYGFVSSCPSSSLPGDNSSEDDVTDGTQKYQKGLDEPESSSRKSSPQALINGGDNLLSSMNPYPESSTQSMNYYMNLYNSPYIGEATSSSSSTNGSGLSISSSVNSDQESSVQSMNYTSKCNLSDFGEVISCSSSSTRGLSMMSCSVDQSNRISVPTNPYSLMGVYGASKYDPDLYYTGQDFSSNYDEFRVTAGTNGYHSDYCVPNCNANFGGLSNQQGVNWVGLITQILLQPGGLVALAQTEEGSLELQLLLRQGNPVMIKMVLEGVVESPFEVMKDQHGKRVFHYLVKMCNHFQLKWIVTKLISHEPSLVDAARNINGSHSIQELIKKLKKLDLAKQVTAALSSGLYELATDNTGRHVIEKCFTCLDGHKTEVLYDELLKHCVDIAMEQAGCICLNECITYITGAKRHGLLERITDESVHLSLDPSGNFVIQNVLGLGYKSFSNKICSRLRGNYVKLSRSSYGSHLVEKCLKSSELALHYLVEDIRKEEGMLQKLALHHFGNYVIQSALEISTKEPFSSTRQYFESTLQPHLPRLEKTTGGRKVAGLIRCSASSESEFNPRSTCMSSSSCSKHLVS